MGEDIFKVQQTIFKSCRIQGLKYHRGNNNFVYLYPTLIYTIKKYIHYLKNGVSLGYT